MPGDTSLIAVGIDGSAPSATALHWAAQAASLRRWPLLLLCAARSAGPPTGLEVVFGEPHEPERQVLESAQALVAAKFPTLSVTTRLVDDTPASALVAASRTASLIVVGNRGHGGFHDLLLGSTSLHTAMHAHCPVAVIRPVPASGDGGAAGQIVAGIDASPHSRAALEYAFTEADLTGRHITAVHAYATALTAYPGTLMVPPVPDPAAGLRRASKLLHQELLPWQEKYSDVTVDTLAVQGSPAAVLIQKSQGAHVTVAGSRGLGGFTGMILGSVGHALIHHAGSPVIIARS